MTALRKFCVLLLVGPVGCVMQPPVAIPPPAIIAPLPVAKATPGEFDELMAYVLHAKTLSSQAFAEETLRVRESFGREKSDLARMKLALALAGHGNADESEMLTLLEPMLQDKGEGRPELRGLAVLLYTTALDRKRSKDSLVTAQARLREMQKSQESNQARIDQQRKQIEELEKKINAFKTIEKSLIQRADKARN